MNERIAVDLYEEVILRVIIFYFLTAGNSGL